jgi:hypothetical protein
MARTIGELVFESMWDTQAENGGVLEGVWNEAGEEERVHINKTLLALCGKTYEELYKELEDRYKLE